jgi:hypothetical protein
MQTDLTKQDKVLFSNTDVRSWAIAAVAAVVWIVLYNVIQLIADWLAYGCLPCRTALTWASRWLSFFTTCRNYYYC